MICETSSKLLHYALEISHNDYQRISNSIFHNIPRVTRSMRHSEFYINHTFHSVLANYTISFLNDFFPFLNHQVNNRRDENTVKIIFVLLFLLIITFITIVVLIYLKYKMSKSVQAPQIVLGNFIEQRELHI